MWQRFLPPVLALAGAAAHAHVSIEPAFGEHDATWRGALHVAHGCEAAATTAIVVRLPPGVTALRAPAKPGWQVSLAPAEVAWTSAAGSALDSKSGGDFPLELRVAAAPGPLWLKVQQRCGATTLDWSQVPSAGASTEGMKSPAVLLQVMTPQQAAAWRVRPSVENAWIRASVPGQSATGAFMRITANEPTQLVKVDSPVAAVAEVHEMKMEGDVMRMRPAGTLDLPVGRVFELKPGGYHLMLQDLKKPLEAGSTVPLTLVFRNPQGVESRVEVRAPVSAAAPETHKH